MMEKQVLLFWCFCISVCVSLFIFWLFNSNRFVNAFSSKWYIYLILLAGCTICSYGMLKSRYD